MDENGGPVQSNWNCLPGGKSSDGVAGDSPRLQGSKFSEPRSAASPRARAPIAWRIKDIDWVFIIKSQLWATAIITLIPVAMLGVIHWALKPRIRPFAIYDATISYPLRSDTIPAWVAIVIPFALMAISLCIGELILFKRVHRNITMALSTMLHFLIDIAVAFLFTIFMTELTKVATGVLRPDFLTLADCQPAASTTLTGQPLTIGASGTQSLLDFPCRADVKTQRNARQAFVSGHASTATVFAFYNCGYLLWCFFYRQRHSIMSHVVARKGKRGVWLKDFGQALAMYWVLIQICFGWGVGISRIIDNKHSTADVVGGFVLGAMFGLVFVLKAIPTAKYVVGQGPEFEMAYSQRLDSVHGAWESMAGPARGQGAGTNNVHPAPSAAHNEVPVPEQGHPQPGTLQMV